jgi:DNA protecting protein DprA
MNFPIHCFQRFASPALPPEIWDVPQPPFELFIQGSAHALQVLANLPERGLAIVGTRNPQARSVVALRQWIAELAHSNLIILSGLARGIDAVAHTAALDAGLTTIAILGAGLDINYPRENELLRKRILNSGGLLISEFPPGTAARGHQFLLRNRLIASWAKATWVVEAGQPSGALSTARWARDQNRTCFAVPCFPGDANLSGNQTLLDRDHALAFWGTHSLGAAWLELAAQVPARASHRVAHTKKLVSADERALTAHLASLTSSQGGAQLQDLLNWALTQGWNAQRFFLAFESSERGNRIVEHAGTLVSL